MECHPPHRTGRLRGLLGTSIGGLGGVGVHTRTVAGIFNSVPIKAPLPFKCSLPTPSQSTHLTLSQCHFYSGWSDHDKGSDNTRDTGDEMIHNMYMYMYM